MSKHLRWILGWLLAIACWAPLPAWAQGDGPRAYQVVPNGTSVLSLYGLMVRGNQSADPGVVIQGGDIDVDLALLQFTHSFALAGQQAAAFAVLPYGEVSGSLRTPLDRVNGSSRGIGDVILGAVVGLVGPPPLTLQEFVAYQPGFALGVLGKITLPTGEYSSEKLLNVGANRWSLQIGAPMGWYLGTSFLDPALATIELLPSVQFYGDNNEPRGGGSTGQKPIFRLEAHVTRNLHKAVWVSLDGLYVYGGETRKNGEDDGNKQRALELGGTLNLAFSPTASVKLSYGEVVSRNDQGPDGSMTRLIASFAF